jgi:hypothetical protein
MEFAFVSKLEETSGAESARPQAPPGTPELVGSSGGGQKPEPSSGERTSLKLPAVVIAGITVRRRCTDDLREKSDKAIIVVSV